MRNWRTTTISGMLYKELFTKETMSFVRCTEGLPEGAAFVRSYYNERKDMVTLVWEHPTFADVPEGGIVPELEVEFRSYDCPFIRGSTEGEYPWVI